MMVARNWIIQEHSNIMPIRASISPTGLRKYVRILFPVYSIYSILNAFVDPAVEETKIYIYIVFIFLSGTMLATIWRIWADKPKPENFSETHYMVDNTMRDTLSLVALILLLMLIMILRGI